MNASAFLDTAPETQLGPVVAPLPRPSIIGRHLASPAASVAQAFATVARRFAVTYDELTGRDRHQRITNARQVLAWILRQYGLSFPEIGALLQRDHTTIQYAVAKIERERGADEQVRRALDALKDGVA
jgi:chromosomal replication initiation ATPase DnaA